MLFHHGGLNSYEQEKDHQTLSFQEVQTARLSACLICLHSIQTEEN